MNLFNRKVSGWKSKAIIFGIANAAWLITCIIIDLADNMQVYEWFGAEGGGPIAMMQIMSLLVTNYLTLLTTLSD